MHKIELIGAKSLVKRSGKKMVHYVTGKHYLVKKDKYIELMDLFTDQEVPYFRDVTAARPARKKVEALVDVEPEIEVVSEPESKDVGIEKLAAGMTSVVEAEGEDVIVPESVDDETAVDV